MLKVVVAGDKARVCQLILMLADWGYHQGSRSEARRGHPADTA